MAISLGGIMTNCPYIGIECANEIKKVYVDVSNDVWAGTTVIS